MSYIISSITSSSILMASDSRLNYHIEEIDILTGEKFQVIMLTADCIRKTFVIDPYNIGIQFIGIGYFPENENKYPISYFINRLSEGVTENDKIEIKFYKIFTNLAKLTEVGNTGQFMKGIMTGYQNSIPYICIFNTFNDEFEVNSSQIGTYVESEKCDMPRPIERSEAIEYINERITSISQNRPQDVGGAIEILELKSDGTNLWLQENSILFNGTQRELLEKMQNDLISIGGKILNPPFRQKIEL